MRRQAFFFLALSALSLTLAVTYAHSGWGMAAVVLALTLVGLNDLRQHRHTIRRNFPVIGHFRYLLESIRPEINQYFVESETDGRPFPREARSLVYRRAKGQRDSLPFGTRQDVYAPGYECVLHARHPTTVDPASLRVVIGGSDCTQPYDSSIFYISAMSFGSLSGTAVQALNGGAKLGGFAHNTGEGGFSPKHLEPGGDVIWQIGTGYFGCRTADGRFDPDAFATTARRPVVKMIELKLSQGAKPGLGGLLPGGKVSPEIAAARGVPMGKDVVSPARHSAFQDDEGLLRFVSALRELSGGKPVGIKMCLGDPAEFDALAELMARTGQAPDYIAVDGAEGGTGAAPVEFSNHVGLPLAEALVAVNQSLIRHGLRGRVKIVASGKVKDAFDVVRAMALGADACASARGMMLALGCIQALRCDSNKCPAGIATQDPGLAAGLVPTDKAVRVANYHRSTVAAVAKLMGAMGIEYVSEITPARIMRRGHDGKLRSYAAIYPWEAPDVREFPAPRREIHA